MIYNNFIKVPTLLNEVNEELKKSEYTKKNIPTKPMTDEELFNVSLILLLLKSYVHTYYFRHAEA